MSRSPVKSWKNVAERRLGKRKSYNGWTRRVIWYQAGTNDIRLQFEEIGEGIEGKRNRYYTDKDKAEADFKAFTERTLKWEQ